MERAPLPSSPAAAPVATDDRAMLDPAPAHSERPREGDPPTPDQGAHEARPMPPPDSAKHKRAQQSQQIIFFPNGEGAGPKFFLQ